MVLWGFAPPATTTPLPGSTVSSTPSVAATRSGMTVFQRPRTSWEVLSIQRRSRSSSSGLGRSSSSVSAAVEAEISSSRSACSGSGTRRKGTGFSMFRSVASSVMELKNPYIA